MASHNKPRTNARKSAARAIQQKTGLRYKKALAILGDPAPAHRIVTAPGIPTQSGQIMVASALDAVTAAQNTLVVPPPTPEKHKQMPDWRRRLQLSNALPEHNNIEASAILSAAALELTSRQAVVHRGMYLVASHATAARTATPEPGPESFTFELQDNSFLTQTLADRSMTTRFPEPLPPHDRDTQWAQSLLTHLHNLRQQLSPLRGTPVDELRSVIDHLVWWLTGEHRAAHLGAQIAERFHGSGLREDIPELRGHPVQPAEFDES